MCRGKLRANGDGLFHVAPIQRGRDAEATIDSPMTQLCAAPLFDEDEII